jgi:adenylyl-sulfate kinase
MPSFIQPKTFWFTGLSGAGKSSLAAAYKSALRAREIQCAQIDGDLIRARLNHVLGFSLNDRRENIRRVAEIARLLNADGLIVLVSVISPNRNDREYAREIIGAPAFVEVYVNTPLEICEQRDPKGLYRLARSGKIANFTGISSEYQVPFEPALEIDTNTMQQAVAIDLLMQHLDAPIWTNRN